MNRRQGALASLFSTLFLAGVSLTLTGCPPPDWECLHDASYDISIWREGEGRVASEGSGVMVFRSDKTFTIEAALTTNRGAHLALAGDGSYNETFKNGKENYLRVDFTGWSSFTPDPDDPDHKSPEIMTSDNEVSSSCNFEGVALYEDGDWVDQVHGWKINIGQRR